LAACCGHSTLPLADLPVQGLASPLASGQTESTVAAARQGDTRRSRVGVVATFYRAFNEEDFEAAAGYLSEDLEWRPAFGRSLMGANAYAGRHGFLRYCEDLRESFTTYRSELEDLEQVGHSQVLAHVRASGTGRTSGIEVDREFWILYELRDGLIAKGETFEGRIEALRSAAGV
jgi:ketosteroid isomerase-like protein